MDGFLRANTAVTIKAGPFVTASNGDTDQASLTISQADVRLSKNGGNFAQKNDSGAATYDEIGYYDIDLNTTDTNTLGTLVLAVHESETLHVRHTYMVMPEWWYDFNVEGGGVTYGTLQAVTDGANFRLHSGAVSSNGKINGMLAYPISGSGAGQAPRTIVSSSVTDDSVLVDPEFITSLSTDTKVLLLLSPPSPTNPTYVPKTNPVAFSGSATAVSNTKDFFTTGFSATNSTVGYVNTTYVLDGHTAQTGDNYALLGTPTGSTVGADIATVNSGVISLSSKLGTPTGSTIGADIATVQSTLGTAGDGLTSIPEQDVNVAKVNKVTVTGSGSEANPWIPA